MDENLFTNISTVYTFTLNIIRTYTIPFQLYFLFYIFKVQLGDVS